MSTTPSVYIVDDDEAVREGLKLLVEAFGWSAHAFASAEEFLDVYSDRLSGCLLLDLDMPGMTGVELQERLQELDSRLAVIMITAYPDHPLVGRARRAGTRAVMSKPFNDDELLANIHDALADTD